jgi:hypothetical protein
MAKTRVNAHPETVEQIRDALVADCGCNHPLTHQTEAQSLAEALARSGMTIVLHRQSVDGDGRPLRYCATCFRDWPCECAPVQQPLQPGSDR